MDFTREPIIETVITPREGYRLVVRSSKSAGLEEYFVDALEVVTFGNASFFRSTERPKPFIVPVGDYEILEVREPRMVLKTPIEGSIKIAASEKAPSRKQQQQQQQQQQIQVEKEQPVEKEDAIIKPAQPPAIDARADRRRDRRRGLRRRRGQGREDGREDGQDANPREDQVPGASEENDLQLGLSDSDEANKLLSTTPMLSSILPPPTTLIRDDLERLRKHEAYKSAFYREGEFEESDLPSEPYDFSEREIEMKEGGDQGGGSEGVPSGESFRDSPLDSSNEELFPEANKVDQP